VIVKTNKSTREQVQPTIERTDEIKAKNDVKATTKANSALKTTMEDSGKKTNNAIMASSNKLINNRVSTSTQNITNNQQSDPFYVKANGANPAFLFA